MVVRIKQAKDGDWVELRTDDDGLVVTQFEGHSIPEHVWIDLLEQHGATVIYDEGDFCDCGAWVREGEVCDFCETYVPECDEAEE